VPLQKLVFKSGVNRDQTNYASEGGWYEMDKVRFRSGFPEKLGGWIVATSSEYSGIGRSLFAWNTTDGGLPIGIGTNEKMYISLGSNVYDITPLRATYYRAISPATNNCFTTINGSTTVTVTVTSHGIIAGTQVTFSGATAVGGVIAGNLNATFTPYNITTDTFDITVAAAATSNASGGGTSIVMQVGPSTANCFTTSTGTKVVTVTINSHGADEGDYVIFSGATGPVGGIPATSLNTEFKIFNVTGNTFQITTASTASSIATGGGTAITAKFQVHVGNATLTAGYGWGVSPWGSYGWGTGSPTPIFEPIRLIYQTNFNNDLFFNIRYSDIFYWTYSTSPARAVYLKNVPGSVAVPQQVTRIAFTSQGFLLAMGCTTYDPNATAPDYLGYFDPLMIRWSNVDPDIGPEPENWQPTQTNSAGFLRIQTGSAIITSIGTRQETLIWTDTSLNSLQFLGTAEVFSVQQLSAHTTIIGPNAAIGANNITYWMGTDKFFTYSGRVDTLPCTLRQYVFQDINLDLGDYCFAGSNVQFNEIIWFYVSADGAEINRYVVYNYSENIWYYGQIERTAWMDSVATQYPIALDNGWLYYHENGVDDGQPLGADPLPITAYIQSADIDITDGDKYMLIRRIIPDVNFTGSDPNAVALPNAQITVGVRNFPGAANATSNASGIPNLRNVVTTTATIDQYTNQVFVRARGRQMNFKISSDTVGTQWQLGMPRMDAREDGSRS